MRRAPHGPSNHLHADLVEEYHGRAALAEAAAQLPHGAAHQTGLRAHRDSPDLPL